MPRTKKSKIVLECKGIFQWHYWHRRVKPDDLGSDECGQCGAIRKSHWTKDKEGNLLEFVVDKITFSSGAD